MDGLKLSCGALSIKPETHLHRKALFLPESRIYLTYEEMIKAEAALPADEKSILSLLLPKFCTFCTCNDGFRTWF
jgi:hypothetical protein